LTLTRWLLYTNLNLTLKIYLQTNNELCTSSLLKVVLHTDMHPERCLHRKHYHAALRDNIKFQKYVKNITPPKMLHTFSTLICGETHRPNKGTGLVLAIDETIFSRPACVYTGCNITFTEYNSSCSKYRCMRVLGSSYKLVFRTITRVHAETQKMQLLKYAIHEAHIVHSIYLFSLTGNALC